MDAVYVVHTEDEHDHGRITLVGVRPTLEAAQALASQEAEQALPADWDWWSGRYADWKSWQTQAPGDDLTTYVITQQPLT